MRFWPKLFLQTFSIICAIAGLIFIFNFHFDSLIRFAPSNAEVYINFNPSELTKLNAKQRDAALRWLEINSDINSAAWQNIFSNVKHEISLFMVNGKVFGIARDNKQMEKTLTAGNISFVKQDNVLYFPKLIVLPTRISATDWFKQSGQRINLSDFSIYLKNLSYLNIPLATAEQRQPLAITGKIKDDSVLLNVYGDAGQSAPSTLSRQIKTLPLTTNIYLRGMSIDQISQNAPFSRQNFQFLLLQSLKGPVEYLNTDKGFLVYALKEGNSFQQLENSTLTIISNILPTKKSKLLPDNTIAVNLVIDPKAWQFKQINENTVNLLEPRLDLNMTIKQTDNLMIINNNNIAITTANGQNMANNRCTNQISSIFPWLNRHLIYVNVGNNNPQGQLFDSMTIINKSKAKETICLH